ncbi:phage head closure protein [Roseovarius sp. SCSIO 43702]|uniref:phage head closure protein n=1 Tax=Roseovarius sp. SCSIO 43702 TaxID=2823043 RepID=UPI001C73DB32|nr:phage head closure protein [Roseovarius sp. SCSIO 43702]QYX58119.1 phage head closure protein [Roseovarius sp. SCSIO 43702]
MMAGRYDRRAQFRRYVEIDDGFGTVQSWEDHGDPVWVQLTHVSDSEKWHAAQVQATVTSRLRLRWSSFAADISPLDRVICEGRDYNITGVKEIGRRKAIEITASARADQS